MRKSFIGVLLSVIAMLVFNQLVVVAGQAGETGKIQSGAQRLEGRWERPDGGYVLELRDIKKDGRLKANYFNPRPINVFRAEYRITQGKINLFVALRDVNYPGSRYDLQYDPESDRLSGTYFQAVERQTYEIEFVRVKK